MPLTDRPLRSTSNPMLPNVGFVRLSTVLAVYPVGRSTWWAGVRSGRFHPPVKLGPRVTAWSVEAIRELIERDKSCDGRSKPAPTPNSLVRRAHRRTA